MINPDIPGCFSLRTNLSPTYYHISRLLQRYGWKAAVLGEPADFREKHLSFDETAAQQFEYKHLLAKLVADHCREIMPFTYCINDHNWQNVLNRLTQEFPADNTWILKPALMNNGQGIKIFKTANEIKHHYLQTKRFGGEHVLQHYIRRPHLLRDNRKYSIRQFLIVTNDRGSYLYRHGYYNVALQPFKSDDFSDLTPHLTNEHLYGNEPNVLQIPTARFEAYPVLVPQIQKISNNLITALQKECPEAFTPSDIPTFALFGIDLMVDDAGRVWLLEVNHGPCFPVDANHPLQSHLYEEFWQTVVLNFVIPIAKNQMQDLTNVSLLEKLGDF